MDYSALTLSCVVYRFPPHPAGVLLQLSLCLWTNHLIFPLAATITHPHPLPCRQSEVILHIFHFQSIYCSFWIVISFWFSLCTSPSLSLKSISLSLSLSLSLYISLSLPLPALIHPLLYKSFIFFSLSLPTPCLSHVSLASCFLMKSNRCF